MVHLRPAAPAIPLFTLLPCWRNPKRCSVAYKLPGHNHKHWVTVVANSYNRRHFPW